ncbi:hypothetical protein M378DRAFT_171480 [Amanita muscaria Koide BX008]|uniref:Uncharacterized protein n=1 Tax=Amanita muscaria (strain Koide BX008) TaxID=946122 RepID=A0A0C2SUH8_AMAMK|nr:hypothetical protein M378DRAFT_171480 [Amanita muscaria Koide BX008]
MFSSCLQTPIQSHKSSTSPSTSKSISLRNPVTQRAIVHMNVYLLFSKYHLPLLSMSGVALYNPLRSII